MPTRQERSWSPKVTECFFVDLPSEEEREDIFRIHITKRGRDPKDFDVEALADKSQQYSGAEIEAAVVAAMFEAFSDQDEDGIPREVDTKDIIEAMTATQPLAVTRKEEIRTLREWASTRTRAASTRAAPKPNNPGRSLEVD